MTAVVGIDLGGRDFKVAFFLDPTRNIVKEGNVNPRGRTPRLFTFTDDGLFHDINFNIFKPFVGKGASLFSSEEYNKEVTFMNPSASFAAESSTGGTIGLEFSPDIHPGKIFISGVHLLAMLFRRILNTVSDFSALRNSTKNIKTFQAAIIVPVHFDDCQQEAILQAASLAGFAPIGLLRDITTACSAYQTFYPHPQIKIDGEDYTLVIDVGHSSLTVFMVSKDMHILCNEYNHDFGGRDIDLALATHFGKDINATHNFDIFSIPQTRFLLLQQCFKARERLLFSKEVLLELSLPTFNLEYRTLITLDFFHSITSSSLGAIFATIQRTLEESDLTHSSVRTVVFCGKDILLFKPQIMDKFPRATRRGLESFWMAKSALGGSITLPGPIGDTTPAFWIGRQSEHPTITWKQWQKVGLGNDLETIVARIDEIQISGNGGQAPHPATASRDEDISQVHDGHTRPPMSSFVLDSTRDPSQVDVDITKSLAILENTAQDDPGRPDMCNNLCALYMNKYTSTKDILVLNSALVWVAKALGNVDYRSPDAKPEYISNVATCLHYRYDHTQDLHTLNMAILYQSYIVDALPLDNNDPANGGYLINYGVLLQARGEHLGDTDDIVKAGKYLQRAIGLLSSSTNPADRPHLIAAVTNMGNTLQILYKYTGTLDDLYHTIQCFEIALALLENGDTERSVALNGLGLAMMLHYQHFGDLDALNKAAKYFQEALEYIPDDHPSRRLYLSGHANALTALYRNSEDGDIINQAIEIRRNILDLTKQDDPSKANFVDKLGCLYAERFKSTSNTNDLDEAIECHQSALLLTNEDQLTQKSVFLNNLGTTLQTRFVHLKSTEDSTQGILTLELALEHTSYGAARANIVFNLADAYIERYKEERLEPQRLKCIELCKEVVASLAPLTVRFHAAGLWTEAALYSKNGPDTLDATTTMVDLLSQLAWPGLSLSSQISVLRFANHAACNAAAIALHFKDIRRALEWLEQGRTVSWNQLLHIRSPLVDLKAQEPELAEKIIDLSRQLDIGEAKAQGFQSEKFSQNNIALERDKLLQKAREIPGFEKLMMAKDYSNFHVGTYDGPIVVINVSRYRCDALIFSKGRHPMNLPLETFSLELAENLKTMMLETLDQSARLQRHAEPGSQNDADIRFGRPRRARVTEESIDANFRHIMKELWVHIVNPIANCLGFGAEFDEDLPHVWWCSTGPLTFLPLHAAGIYAAKDDHETARISIMDYAVSSYIPSLSALHNIMYKRGERPPFKLLSVIQPSTPGQQPLPATLLELEIIQKCAKKGGLSKDIRVLQGEQATCEAVMKGMREHSWIHLACHGEQDVHEPTKSGLHLHDNSLLLQDIVKSSLPNADFAFLSACQTATGDVAHPDEAVHLAAGMLMAGYRSVIASMWSIGDNDASMVAEDVYDHLFKEGKVPDSRMAARALHRAVRKLRVKHTGQHGGNKFLAWLPFIHVGM